MPQGTTLSPQMPSHFGEGPTPMEPPCNVDAERAILGACMHKADIIDEVRPILGDDAFYRPAHETIWRALLAQHREDKPTDPIVLTEPLQQQGDLQQVGGHPYIFQLAGAPYGTGSAEHHAEIVREKADLRRLVTSAVRTLWRAQEPGADPEAIRSEVEAEVRAERDRALASGQGRLSRLATDGWSFVKESGADAEPLWGRREKTVWAPARA